VGWIEDMIYRIAADLLVVFHFGFICFVMLGGLLAFRWRGIIYCHIPAVLWGIGIELTGGICPLTPWENRLRRMAGGEGYDGGFIENYLLSVIYPEGLTRDVQIALGLFVLVVNAAVYITLFRLKLKQNLTEN